MKLFREKLNEDVLSVDLDRTYRIDKKRDSSRKPRPVIIKFEWYSIREKVFKGKKTQGRGGGGGILAPQKILLVTE